jgi:hexokinase
MNLKANDFLSSYKLRPEDFSMAELDAIFTGEMNNGLAGKGSSLHMIPAYIEADNEFLRDTDVLAIDAGGTNFRAAIVKVKSSGELVTGEIVSGMMPGIEREVTSEEFFSKIASYIRPLAEKADRIGFCFSYATEIQTNMDGKLLHFCKEIRAPEVVGKLIGKSLLETLGTPSKKIVLLNDTVATLLAGKSASVGKNYDSFIGFILGTGSNTAYIEKNDNILKVKGLEKGRSQIINIESGNFARGPRSIIDIEFDKTTNDPGMYAFEKMFSGGYFGGICLAVLKKGALDGAFSEPAAKAILSSAEINSFEASKIASGEFSFPDCNAADSAAVAFIVNTLIERAAKMVAASMASVVLKTGKGLVEDKPVLITVEGTTFYKLHRFRNLFHSFFEQYMTGERKRYVEFTEVERASLTGAALAALID